MTNIFWPLAEGSRTPGMSLDDRFRMYVSRDAEVLADKLYRKLNREPAPFSLWKWRSLAAPGYKQDSFGWLVLRYTLQRVMNAGGVVVLVGAPRSGKTCLLNRLPLQIINAPWPKSPEAATAQDSLPEGIFALDETDRHARTFVLRAMDKARKNGRGCALVFLTPERFKGFGIGAYLADQKVLFLELLEG